MGKSTWRSSETDEETAQRNEKYHKHYISKWGNEVARTYLNSDCLIHNLFQNS
jgi:hypothetical protein